MVTAEFDEQLGIMRFTLRGEISLSMIVGAAMSWMKSDDYRPATPALWDMRNSDWSQVNIEFRHVGASIVKEINQYRPSGVRVAWVVDTLTESSLIETIYGTENWNTKWQAFTSLDEAINWLLAPLEDEPA